MTRQLESLQTIATEPLAGLVTHDVYVSGALSGLSQRAYRRVSEIYESIAAAVDSAGYVPYCPHRSPTAPSKPMLPSEVWSIDHAKVTGSRLVVAYVGVPSLGVGAEIEMARSSGINILLVCEHDRIDRVSRL